METINLSQGNSNVLETNLDSIYQHNFMTKERWEGILACKKDFLINSNSDPRNCPYLDHEIAASWIRSRDAGVQPYAPLLDDLISSEDHKKILNSNRLIIDIARPLFEQFEKLAVYSDYNMSLLLFHNKELIYTRDLVVGIGVNEYDAGNEFDSSKILHQKLVERVCSEKTIGTTAQGLCAYLKRPVQLFGPENYLLAFSNRVASAAPIMDEHGEVIAIINLGQPLIYPPWDKNFQIILSQTLGLLATMAMSIENKFQLIKSYNELEMANSRLKTAYNTLDITFGFIDEGIISIDPKGKIVQFNKEGSRILNIQPETGNRNISEFVANPNKILSIIARGENVIIEEIISVDNDDQQYLLNIQPILNHNTKAVEGAILRLNHSDKVNSLVTSRAGAIAKYRFGDIIGDSKELKNAASLCQRLASSPENLLITGQSGTGKELFAQAIHNHYRPQGPFMAINCAALPRNLIESELFGYEGGSFTGAERNGRPGKIELAHGGTLFLDEIGEMPIELQAVLLRVLENKQVMRIGGRRYKNVDFRTISATNKDIYKMVKENLFREDLFFRLSVLTIKLPALSQRENDVEILSQYFIRSYCTKVGRKIPNINDSVLKIMYQYAWPGNVRQLENAMIYAVNMALGDVIELNHLPEYILSDINPVTIKKMPAMDEGGMNLLTLKESEKQTIEKALTQTENNMSLTARLLGISKSTLYRKMKDYKLFICQD